LAADQVRQSSVMAPNMRWGAGITLIDSYHCSRYNQNTRRLTPAMFDAVFARAIALGVQPARAASI